MIKIGIFFGGSSREREISFVGGRTVYDKLDRNLFEPIPIFVDSLGNFIILNWQHLYKGTIRDFYPSKEFNYDKFSSYLESLDDLSKNDFEKIINKVGIQLFPHEFKSTFDFAFLTLNGIHGEDGTIQGILEWYGIPYSGTGILGSSINIDKEIQRKFINSSLEYKLNHQIITYDKWIKNKSKTELYKNIKSKLGSTFVSKSCNQGSSIGISIIKSEKEFESAVNKSFFIKKITSEFWKSLSNIEQHNFIANQIIDIRHGIGMPITINDKIFYSGNELLEYLNDYFAFNTEELLLESINSESKIILESFIKGREFSCIIIENDKKNPIVLPPTELKTLGSLFDYRAKYLPGIVSKSTPMEITFDEFANIKNSCEKLFKELYCNVYARIDGFLTTKGEVYLNDPNTTSGMNPSSFLFHQSAEIGFTPTQFLTYLIKQSIDTSLKRHKILRIKNKKLLTLDSLIKEEKTNENTKTRIGVLMGGFSSERHISLESGRNVFDKLSSSKEYEPVPIFLSGNPSNHRLFILPINILLKDNADDIHDKLDTLEEKNHVNNKSNSNKILESIRESAQEIVTEYSNSINFSIRELDYKSLKDYVDFIFIALHGRPGEDGEIQSILKKENIPFNGSNVETCNLTMDKYKTNQLLKENGVLIAPQIVVTKQSWNKDKDLIINKLESELNYPIIGKPIDEGCSSAVLKLENRQTLISYIDAILRSSEKLPEDLINTFKLKAGIEFPQKDEVLLEKYIDKGDANHFLEITGGLITELDNQDNIIYNIFEPSESIASNNILSLEEKFLAGEGQNITPAYYSDDLSLNKNISTKVKDELLKVAKILNIEGYARIDAFVKIYNDRIEVIIIEINTLPAMTPATCIFHQAALFGYKPFDFIKAIIDYGFAKHAISI